MQNAKIACTVMAQIKSICDKHGNDAGELINILHETQNLLGYLPEDVQRIVAEKLEIPVSRVYGVVTFYAFFTEKPKGKYPISVCLGTACYVRGSEKLLDEFKANPRHRSGRDYARRKILSRLPAVWVPAVWLQW